MALRVTKCTGTAQRGAGAGVGAWESSVSAETYMGSAHVMAEEIFKDGSAGSMKRINHAWY
jgi:hypothetical protein